MGLRTKAFFIGVFLAVTSPMAAALGLGEIKLNSALNQPLNAEIQLLHVRDLTENEIRIAIASPEEFARAGVERNFFVTDLKFTLDLTASQGPVVRVTSNGPVREPFLNFILSAQWPSGKLLREYTLLVDLPVFSGAQSAPVQAANQSSSQSSSATATTPPPAPRTAPPRPRTETARTETASRSSTFSGDSYGPVSVNETLWSIASRVKPDSSVSVQQTMLAIQRLNPEAFINGNINLLRRGQVLRIPDKDEIQQITNREAVQQVAEQNRSWNDRTQAPERAQLEGSKNFAETRTESSAVEGRVKLSSQSSSDRAGQGVGVEDGSGDGGRASEALSEAQEELDAAGRENSDLKSRIQAMEEQIQTMERLVEVSSTEMRALELAAQQANQEQTEQSSSETPAVNPSEQESPQTSAAETPTAQPEQAPAQATPAKTATPKKSWLDLAKENMLYIGAGLAVLVLGLLAYLIKRNRREEIDEYDGYDSEGDMDLLSGADADGQTDKTVVLDEYDDSGFVEEERALAEAETEDVVGECDIHLAYGQYDQAEEKLLRALEKDPSSAPVSLKLLEVFALQGDAESFDRHYAQLRATAESDVVDRASIMRSSIEGIEPFDASLYETASSEVDHQYETGLVDSDTLITPASFTDDTLDFDFNDVDELVDSTSAVAPADNGEYAADSLDFDLTLDDDDATQIPASKFTGAQEEDLLSPELALDEPTTEIDELNSQVDFVRDTSTDIDFELPEEGLAIADSEESVDDFSADIDLDFEDDRFTSEFADDLVAERSAPKDEESFDFSDLGLSESEAELNFEQSPRSSSDELDFDLDRDLADAQTIIKEEPPVLSSAADDLESGLDDLALNDLDGLDLEVASEPELVHAPSAQASNRVADSGTDFDMDFDLDKEINLDELDHELDALASDFGGESASMEEPVLDFDDENEADAISGFADGDNFQEQDLDDLFVEDGVKPEVVNDKPSAPSYAANSGSDFEIPDFDPENDDDSNLDFLSDNDETATKLDLARAYIDMGDADGAKDILDEIIDEGNDQQKREAESLLARIG
ncbi:MAG: hypothetical protein NVV73_06615 [Cellvibrionaceae bacterium]|nr:hypothetical protein [Cellvibrionaceae bacterium]